MGDKSWRREMSKIDLQEYQQSTPNRLTPEQRDTLRTVIPDLSIDHVAGRESLYILTPGSTVGAVEVNDLSVVIEPKIGISQLLSLACYAIGKVKFQETDVDLREEKTLPDALALALSAAARQAFGRGLLHGYLVHEEALQTVRGRIRFNDQIRRRFGIALPVEVRYDEFTDDITENRLVKAAVARLGGLRLRSQKARTGLGWAWAMLDNVSQVDYRPKDVPEVKFDRLNEHYRQVVALARLILRHGAFESGRGEVRAQGFLMDMNVVFQEFVTVALREALGVSAQVFGEQWISPLAVDGRIALKPDLVWRRGPAYRFVGDAKYKHIKDDRFPNADIYQIFAYMTSAKLRNGMLIYAKGEVEDTTYSVRNADKEVYVATLDLEGDLDSILGRVEELAEGIKGLADVGGSPSPSHARGALTAP